ncbi:hypothetical protein RN001_000254 [Aquatica leii]|uniref:Uncharacterized protein n=1 Tax=Aquatica leii TaxID=1421715 RepID=A0AAN7QLY0_9COLE|nr:hypothetical protein RN001_000254 [Aquatica leii]
MIENCSSSNDADNNGNVRQGQKMHVISDITINRQDILNIFPLKVGTVLRMDSLDIIPVDEINLFTLDNISMNQVLEEPQQNEQNTKKENLKTEQEEDTNKTEDKENIDPDVTEKIEVIRDNLEQATEQEAEDSKNEGTNLKKKEKEERSKESNKFELEEEIKNIEKSPLKLGQSENNDLTTK